MKKSIYQQLTSFLLIITMALSLCACGGDGRARGNENAALAKEHVYSVQEIPLPEFGGDEYEICASGCRDRRISLLVKVTDWKDYNENDIRILSLADDGSDMATARLETVRWNPVGEGSGGQENSWYDNYTFGNDGRIYAARNTYGTSPESGGAESDTEHYLCCWAADGTLLWETALEDFPADDEYVSISAISAAPDGTSRVMLTGGRAYQITVDAWGSPDQLRQLSGETCELFSRSAAVVQSPDGSLLLVCYGEDDLAEQYLISYDPAADMAGEACKMPSVLGWDGYSAVAADHRSGLLYGNRTGICSFCPGETGDIAMDMESANLGGILARSVEKEYSTADLSAHSSAQTGLKMSFINSDINVTSFDTLISLSDTSFAGIFHEGYDSEASLGIFTCTAPENVPDKTVLTLDGCYISNEILQRVVEFNRSSGQYRIVVRRVEEYDSEEELAAGISELNSRILSGGMPDILITDGLPMELYESKGLLADIGALLKKDEELSRVDFLQNVFNAYSTDGKLYYVIPRFTVSTMAGAASTVGGRASWTLSDALQLLKSLPEGTNLIAEPNRMSFLQTAMAYCEQEFADRETGKCHFQSEDFLAIMEYAKSLPETAEGDSHDEEYWRNYEMQFLEGRTLLSAMSVYDFGEVNYYVNELFGEEAAYVGFPAAKGSGSCIRAKEACAISAHSGCPEGAWEFLRYYLTDEYQSGPGSGLPVQTRYFQESAAAALLESAEDPSAAAQSLTKEQMDRLVNFILSVDRRYYYNEEIMDIVTEESAAFFTGDRTAQEAAEIIQRRAQLYLDTNGN